MFFWFVSLVLNFFISRRIFNGVFYLFHNKAVLFVSLHQRTQFIGIEFFSLVVFIIVVAFCFYLLNFIYYLVSFFSTLIIWLLYFYISPLHESEKFLISKENKLLLGQGAALWYYKNYLEKIVAGNLVTHLKEYEHIQKISIPHKLFILCPRTCNVLQYIDEDSEYIQRCGEVKMGEINYGGIKGRSYSVTIYRIKHPNMTSPFRCALEYAQPLKNLLSFYNLGRISEEEMNLHRDMFCQCLKTFLERSMKTNYCEVIEYDDNTTDPLWKTIMDSCS